jgi:hypothetical protein
MARIRLLFVLCLLLVVAACGKEASPNGGVAANGDKKAAAPHKAMLEVRVDIALDVGSGDDAARIARDATDRAVAAGGFAETLSIGSHGSNLVLRVPPAEIEAVRAILTANGPLAHETRSSRDVTDAVMDLDARVRSAKVEEARLLDLLQNKAGNLADVLAVEKALADVRERIERFETEQRAAHGRVDLAIVAISLNVRGAFDGAPIGRQLIIAGREGVALARATCVLAATTTLRIAPTLLLIALAGFSIVRVVRRARRPA